ncbi:hypothetical protein WR25_22589 [Diploscapter pachys]|uniref:C2H2-type domain-containing protein n=1 Tax=Diploscapter pachys TaxID=2018661 RepID=A0A2A2KJI2_9BILA|nr:hypothetical protein WR25_22589 [Diploscapter pachys]
MEHINCSSTSPNVDGSRVLRAVPCGSELCLSAPSPSLSLPSPSSPLNMSIDTSASVSAAGFSCDRCGKIFSYSYYRDKHLKYTRCIDDGKRTYKCTICSRSFEKRDRLRIHVLHVHENHRPHTCTLCNKSFSQSSSLNKCSFCPKAFTASSILRTHIRQHSGEKPFKCAVCGKPFASHAAHDSHVRRTHGLRSP